MECPKCGYKWESNSELKFVTCPSCQIKVLRKKGQNSRKAASSTSSPKKAPEQWRVLDL